MSIFKPRRKYKCLTILLIPSLLLLAEPLSIASGVRSRITLNDSGSVALSLRKSFGVTHSYLMSAGAQQVPGAQEQVCANASQAMTQAESLRAEWKVSSLNAAIEKYGEAQRCWHEANLLQDEARALKGIGDVYYILSDYKKARDYYSQALQIRRDGGDSGAIAEALNDVSQIYLFLGDGDQAFKYSNEALTISRQMGDKLNEARALNNIGKHSAFLGEEQEALDYYNEALPAAKASGNLEVQAQTLLNIGYIHIDIDEAQAALNYYNEALTLWQALNHLRGQARTLTAMGTAYTFLGEKQKALDDHKQASQILQAMGDRFGEAVTFNNIGYTYEALGEEKPALEFYLQALKIYQEVGIPLGQAVTLQYVADIYKSLGQTDEAQKYYEQGLNLCRSMRDRLMEADALNAIGRFSYSLGKREEAYRNYKESLAIYQEANDWRGQASALNNIGNYLELRGEKQTALEHYTRALKLARSAQNRGAEILTLYNLAHLEQERGNYREARSWIEASLNLIEALRTKVTNEDLRASYFASVYQHYELYIDVLMQMHKQSPADGFDRIALEASERARARSLLEMLMEAHADLRQGVAAELLAREHLLQKQLNNKAERQRELLKEKGNESQAEALSKEISALTSEYREIGAQIKIRSPRYAALVQPQTLTLSEIQKEVCDSDTILLEYVLGEKHSYLWTITPTRMESFELPARQEIEKSARDFYDLLRARSDRSGETTRQKQERVRKAEARYPEAARALSKILLGPAAPFLGTKRLLIVSDGVLQYMPFASLPAPLASNSSDGRSVKAAAEQNEEGVPLVVEHEIVNLPSASVLVVLRHEMEGRKPAERAVAVLADPVFNLDDDRVRLKVKGSSRPALNKVSQESNRSRSQRGLETNPGKLPAPSVISATQEADVLRSARQAGLLTRGNAFERLSSSRQEAEAIFAIAPPEKSIKALDFEANIKTATSRALSQYRIVHFATHAFLNDEHPELSGLVLSLVDEKGAPQDGFLRLHEVYNLNLPAELVVLSACQTALGKQIKGEGLIGLTRGFMYAGAKSVVASLWEIDDQATAELMDHFYREMLLKDKSPAAALRAAQIAMWDQKNRKQHSPYYWAAFVLQGEWSR